MQILLLLALLATHEAWTRRRLPWHADLLNQPVTEAGVIYVTVEHHMSKGIT
jgi:hypothetical protein